MKLLLTSAGLTNPAICEALAELAGKPLTNTKILVVITAAVASSDEYWHTKGLRRIHDQNFKTIDVIDFSALPPDVWRPRFESADILFFAGGNPYHLINQVRRSGLAEKLPDLLKSRVYVGHSAGSAITGPSLGYSTPKKFIPEELGPYPIPGLKLVDFCVRSHLDNPKHPSANEAAVRKLYSDLKTPVYAIGDYTALKVAHDTVTIVGDQKFLKLPSES